MVGLEAVAVQYTILTQTLMVNLNSLVIFTEKSYKLFTVPIG
jgi:hypothetical protein